MDESNYFSKMIDEIKSLFSRTPAAAVSPGQSPSGHPAQSKNVILSPGGYVAPIHGTWASSGGFTYTPNPTHPKGHMGVDMRAPTGTPVHPLTSGIVTFVGTDPYGGNVVNVAHAGGIRTYYAHLSVINVFKGDKVTVDSVLGAVGMSGNAKNTVPHLHFQVWKDGQIQDPAKFFSVPPYTNLSFQEKKQGPWLSEEARQNALAFDVKKHVANKRIAFSKDVDKLVKLSINFDKFSKNF